MDNKKQTIKLIVKKKPISLLALTIGLLSGSVHAGGFNIPTAQVDPVTGVSKPVPSPLCINGSCATEFTAKMFTFEEFGTFEDTSKSIGISSIDNTRTFPAPADCTSGPDGALLDGFLKEKMNSIPVRVVDETIPNPWEAKVNECLATKTATVAEGRPGGEQFAHQRWDEFPYKRFFQSAQSGARVNGGLRDGVQLHGYANGEFGPNGLYYIDANGDGIPGTAGAVIKLHPNLPIQDKNSVWTFDGTLPPKILMARYGEPLIFRHFNGLPIDASANNGFAHNTISTHDHNGHNPAESDGFAHAYIYPGQFYDYHWPMILAGHDSINTGATDPRAGAPDGHGGITPIPGDYRETMSSHWFHDHMLDYTAQNVYKGNAAAMNYYSALDRGREPTDLNEAKTGIGKTAVEPLALTSSSLKTQSNLINPGYACHYADPANINLCLPSGTSLDWGNRDYDVNLLMADKAWDQKGQLKFNIFNLDGFLGDRITVNWQYKPTFDVRPRRYRFRILDGAVSRDFKNAIVKEVVDAKGVKSYTKIPFHLIANDGNLMEHTVKFPNALSTEAMPEQAIGERYDIIVDFAGLPKGTKLYMVNLAEHQNGTGPTKYIPLANVLAPAAVDGVVSKAPYIADGVKGDPGIGKFLEFKVTDPAPVDMSRPYQPNPAVAGYNPAQPDYSMNPAEYEETLTTTQTVRTTTVIKGKATTTTSTKTVSVPGKVMIPINRPTQTDLANAVHRTFDFGRGGGTDLAPWSIKTDGGASLTADEHRISAAPVQGAVEIWHIKGAGGWTHPVHAHFEEGQILYRGGKAPPPWEKFARKDLYRVGPTPDSTTQVDMAIRFRDFAGTYVEHCHNTQHEDHAMLLRWDLEHPGQTLAMPTPMPDWNGVQYEPSIYLPTAKTGDLTAKKGFVIPTTLPK